jgi:7-cyano-7-deazaguanine synthase in queuosine biosynthesis
MAQRRRARRGTANEVELLACSSVDSVGRARLVYSVDGVEHTFNAWFHERPNLAPAEWDACLAGLAIAGLVDIASATLAKRASSRAPVATPGAYDWSTAAANALRTEQVAEWSLSPRHIPLRLSLPRGLVAPRRVKTDDEKVLLLVGGGKDSLYSYDLLTRAGYDVTCFYMTEASRTWQQLRKAMGYLSKNSASCRAFLNANQTSWLETISGRQYVTSFQIGFAIFLAVPYALGYGCRYIAIGAEKSANERTGTYRSLTVRHQFDKSTRFLALVNKYLRRLWGESLEVVSPLHGLYDLGIYARFLASCPELLTVQSSCGGSNGYRRHCGRCAKCAFVAAMFCALSADSQSFRAMFPRNPLDDVSLLNQWFRGKFERPRTCVGSLTELRVSLRLGRARGWTSTFHRHEASHFPKGVSSNVLERLLASHHNAGLGDQMRGRIQSAIRYDPSEILGLYARHNSEVGAQEDERSFDAVQRA